MRALAMIGLAAVLAGCAVKGPGATVAPTDQSGLEPGVTYETDAPVVEPAPVDVETGSAHVGEAVRITCGGTDCLDVTVIKAKFASKFGSGYAVDTPAVKGHVLLAVYVKYRSLLSGTSYSLTDWQLYVNDEVVEQGFAIYGPTPQLSVGNLPKGKSVSGWMFWEVPKTGRVVISYGASYSQAAVFEVPLRSK